LYYGGTALDGGGGFGYDSGRDGGLVRRHLRDQSVGRLLHGIEPCRGFENGFEHGHEYEHEHEYEDGHEYRREAWANGCWWWMMTRRC
jgi:hypothetical protein